MLFRKRFKIKKDMIPKLYPTSKVGLKQMCLMYANGDLEKAQKLYDYMIKDLEELPVFDPIHPNTMQQVTKGLNDTFNWVKENQEELFLFADLVKGMFSKNKAATGANLPSTQMNVPAQPIPPIN